jgi:hypothetical protein
MVELEILMASDQHGDEAIWEPLVRLRVEARSVDIVSGDRGVVDFTMPVVSLRTHDQVSFEDDPEEWARSLPTAFRTGDVMVRILDDTDPLRAAEVTELEVERHEVRLRERLGQRA